MSETGFFIFNKAFVAGMELLYATALALFLRPFFTRNLRGRLLGVFGLYLCTTLVYNGLGGPQGFFSLLLMVLLTAFSGFLGLEKPKSFLAALLYWNAKATSALMVESVYFIAEQLFPLSIARPDLVYTRSAGLLALLFLSHGVLFSLLLYTLQKRLQKKQLYLHWQELCYLSLVPTAGVLFGQIIARLLVEEKDGVLFQLYERHPEFLAVVPLLALLFYVGSYLTIAFQQNMAALREEQAAHCAEYQQIQAMQGRIHEAEQFYASIRGFKHEMRGHLTNIKGLAQSGQYTSLEDYIAHMDESMRDFELTLQTGNPVTDVIVGDIQRQCLNLDICFDVEFHFPNPQAYDAFDVGVILQNLLQNAVEACEKVHRDKRFIVLMGKKKGRFFLIEVKNSFTGKVAFGQGGLPATTKQQDTPMHGIGLANVRRVAEKYMGELELKAGQEGFSATVLLQERR